VVYPRQHIPGLEEEQLPIIDPWKSYAFFAFFPPVFINLFSDFAAGAGKSILWYVASYLLLIGYLHF
jgi:hypothetical protein